MDTTTRLRADIETLASSIGPRHLWRFGSLARAAEFIEAELSAAGYRVERQTYHVDGMPVSNLEARLEGLTAPDESLVVGAHYDTIEECPGANDNGTGIAATLELARRFAARPQARSIRFVAFVNEEPPYFQTARMGSHVYARAARDRREQIVGMLSMETIGYYSDEPGSQQYPSPLSHLFPDVGNFIGVVGNLESTAFLARIREAFEAHSSFPIQTAAIPSSMPGAGWSDHWSFWEAGYPAVMVTDTAPFRYPWYHTPHDTAEKIAYDKLALVIDGFEPVVAALAGR
jgi:Zn-dependent M28 family amino/carboxypeptidase